VIALKHDDVRVRTVRGLRHMPEGGRRIVQRRAQAQPNRHAVREVAAARTRDEDARHGAHDPETVRNRSKHFLQRPFARPPELVCIGVEHPIGAVLDSREPGHVRHPLALEDAVVVATNEANVAGAHV
jgi:hypothetical protein